MKRKLLIFLIAFVQSIYADEVRNADESNLVKVPLEDVLSDVQNLFPGISDLRMFQGESPVDLKSLNFLFGEMNTSDIERLSSSYQNKIEQIKRDGGIAKVEYCDKYNLRSGEPSGLQISFKMNAVDGWGFGKNQSVNETFLLKGYLGEASRFLKVSPKKNEAWHVERLSKVYPGFKEPLITKIDDSTWVHVFRMVSPSNEKNLMQVRVGKIYFEKYGKSIEIFTENDLALVEWFDFATRFGKRILEQIEQIGIYPDQNSVELVAEKRVELFGDSGIPSFVLDTAIKPTASSKINIPKTANNDQESNASSVIFSEENEFAEKETKKYQERPSNLPWIIAGVLLLGILALLLKVFKSKSTS